MMDPNNLFAFGLVVLAVLQVAIIITSSLHDWRWGLLVLIVPPLSLAIMARLPRTVAPLVAGQFAAVFLLLPAMMEEERAGSGDAGGRADETAGSVEAERRIDALEEERNALNNLAVREALLERRKAISVRMDGVLSAWAAVREQRRLLAPRLAIESGEDIRRAWDLLEGMHRRELRALAEEDRSLAAGQR